jgi:hypothetical protein
MLRIQLFLSACSEPLRKAYVSLVPDAVDMAQKALDTRMAVH